MKLSKLRHWYHYSRYKTVLQLLNNEEKVLNKQAILLDIGCGPPADDMPSGAFLDYIGFGEGMDIVQREMKHPFTLGDVQDIPKPDNTFDYVIALEIIEHVPEQKLALKEIHRVLKPNGILILSTPNSNWVWKLVWWAWQKVVQTIWKETHIREFNKKELIEFLEKDGWFKVEETKTVWGINLNVKVRKK